jgi:hypothetical protein
MSKGERGTAGRKELELGIDLIRLINSPFGEQFIHLLRWFWLVREFAEAEGFPDFEVWIN